MKVPPLLPGRFLRRDNRFRATVSVDGQEVWAHVPNSGRLADLFAPNRPVWLAPAAASGRKTAYDLKLVEHGSVLVSVDARLPNPLFAEAARAGRLPSFDYPAIQGEVTYGVSRLDFHLEGPDGVCWVETKSVTLVEGDTALFPDVPTSRGSRHLRTLMNIRQGGARAAVVFVVQRSDAQRLSPHERADPLFAATLREAVSRGVEAYAFTCWVSHTEISLDGPVPVELDPD